MLDGEREAPQHALQYAEFVTTRASKQLRAHAPPVEVPARESTCPERDRRTQPRLRPGLLYECGYANVILRGNAMRTLASRLTVLAATLLFGCEGGEKQSPSGTEILVAVVGDGVPGGTAPENAEPRVFPLNRAQGAAMWYGAYEALQKSPDLALLKGRVRLVPYDDRGSTRNAEAIAGWIQNQPRVVAVIVTLHQRPLAPPPTFTARRESRF